MMMKPPNSDNRQPLHWIVVILLFTVCFWWVHCLSNQASNLAGCIAPIHLIGAFACWLCCKHTQHKQIKTLDLSGSLQNPHSEKNKKRSRCNSSGHFGIRGQAFVFHAARQLYSCHPYQLEGLFILGFPALVPCSTPTVEKYSNCLESKQFVHFSSMSTIWMKLEFNWEKEDRRQSHILAQASIQANTESHLMVTTIKKGCKSLQQDHFYCAWQKNGIFCFDTKVDLGKILTLKKMDWRSWNE